MVVFIGGMLCIVELFGVEYLGFFWGDVLFIFFFRNVYFVLIEFISLVFFILCIIFLVDDVVFWKVLLIFLIIICGDGIFVGNEEEGFWENFDCDFFDFFGLFEKL